MSTGKDIASVIGNKLNGWQAFVVILLLTVGLIATPAYSSYKQGESNKAVVAQLQLLNTNVEGRNINNLDYNASRDTYEDIFESSMCHITRMAMKTIKRNHIDDKRRQEWIKDQYLTEIMSLYKEDVSKLNNIKYKSKRLGAIMNDIDPIAFTDSIMNILFDKSRTHNQRMIDVEKHLNNKAHEFTQLGIAYLDKE